MERSQLEIKEGGLILKSPDSFELKHIFECGQCFRWYKDSDLSYTGVAFGKLLHVEKVREDIHLNGAGLKDFQDYWSDYFDLGTDYRAIKNQLAEADPIMKQATDFGVGLRILRQELWETLISFIISANNNIPRIKQIIEQLSQRYGDYLGTYSGKKYYAFPKATVLKDASEAELRACNTGYRAAYIKATAEKAAAIGMNPNALTQQDTDECHRWLQEFSGVGPKVANCIAFFSLGKLDSFPVDVWIKRLMEYYYFHETSSIKEIEKFAKIKFGQYAGYAQQYLFYYGRELEIGKGD